MTPDVLMPATNLLRYTLASAALFYCALVWMLV